MTTVTLRGGPKGPFDKVNRFGAPWHGWVSGGVLTPFNGGPARSITIGVAGGTQPRVVRNPVLPADTRTAEQVAYDAANFLDWQLYALDYAGSLYGEPYTLIPQIDWLVCDAAGAVWIVRVAESGEGAEGRTVDVILRKRFGVIGREPAPSGIGASEINRTLTTITIPGDEMTPTGAGDWLSPGISGKGVTVSPSESGRSALINVFAGSSEGTLETEHLLRVVLEVSITGAGVQTEGVTEGDGLGASISVYKAASALGQAESVTATNSSPCPPEYGSTALSFYHNGEADTTETGTSFIEYTETRDLMYVKTNSGVAHVSLSNQMSRSHAVSAYKPSTGLDWTNTETVSQQTVLEFAGESITYTNGFTISTSGYTPYPCVTLGSTKNFLDFRIGNIGDLLSVHQGDDDDFATADVDYIYKDGETTQIASGTPNKGDYIIHPVRKVWADGMAGIWI
ncbi:MAG: hypothetical protein V2J89_11070 [Halieaceae bacterium]|jgi:hypothetical protein|nr:hypothetical protein [Halieaceae bacterium]